MLRSIVKLLKNTHRDPINKGLHAAGVPIYAYGIASIIGYFAGTGTNVLLGLAFWALAILMFVTGHVVEGNVRTMTPVLLTRLVFRLLFRNHLTKYRIHLLR